MFNPRHGFMAPRTASGEWIEPFNPTWSGGQGGRDYFHGDELVDLHLPRPAGCPRPDSSMGGREKFSAKLDQLFREQYRGFQEGAKFVFLRLLPRPDRSDRPIRPRQRAELPHPVPLQLRGRALEDAAQGPRDSEGLVSARTRWAFAGDEDDGELSSWYVFSAMGFYPVCPGKPVYDIGSPIFDEVRLRLPDGRIFTVIARDVSATNKYIQSAHLNGQPLEAAVRAQGPRQAAARWCW